MHYVNTSVRENSKINLSYFTTLLRLLCWDIGL